MTDDQISIVVRLAKFRQSAGNDELAAIPRLLDTRNFFVREALAGFIEEV
jgi:hypothetical protein